MSNPSTVLIESRRDYELYVKTVFKTSGVPETLQPILNTMLLNAFDTGFKLSAQRKVEIDD